MSSIASFEYACSACGLVLRWLLLDPQVVKRCPQCQATTRWDRL